MILILSQPKPHQSVLLAIAGLLVLTGEGALTYISLADLSQKGCVSSPGGRSLSGVDTRWFRSMPLFRVAPLTDPVQWSHHFLQPWLLHLLSSLTFHGIFLVGAWFSNATREPVGQIPLFLAK